MLSEIPLQFSLLFQKQKAFIQSCSKQRLSASCSVARMRDRAFFQCSRWKKHYGTGHINLVKSRKSITEAMKKHARKRYNDFMDTPVTKLRQVHSKSLSLCFRTSFARVFISLPRPSPDVLLADMATSAIPSIKGKIGTFELSTANCLHLPQYWWLRKCQ